MSDLPAMLNLRGRRCVVVGGGGVARRRLAALRAAGADLTVIAPQIQPEIPSLCDRIERRPYRQGDLDGAFLVVAATDSAAVNQQVSDGARKVGALVNRADDPASGDFSIPAHAHHGVLTLVVHTDGSAPFAAGTIRRELSEALDPDWPRLLEIIAPYRRRLLLGPADDKRRQRLARLSSPQAMKILKEDGTKNLRRFCEKLCGGNGHSDARLGTAQLEALD